MTIAKQERHEQELSIYALRSEAGIQALRTWVYARRDQINRGWIHAYGEALLQIQGEARIVAEIIQLIDEGPKIKTEGGK